MQEIRPPIQIKRAPLAPAARAPLNNHLRAPANRRLLMLIKARYKLLIIILAVILTMVWLYDLSSTNKNLKQQLEQTNKQQVLNNKGESQELIEKVGRLIVLPEGEQPTIATVQDLEKLKDQPFFARAQTGDKVLIYSVSKKAILYRPSVGKIIEVAPFTPSSQGQ